MLGAETSLAAGASALSPSDYDLRPLLGEEDGAALTVAAGGGFADYVPLATLAPLTGYDFDVVPAA